jgi:hypothetical protein
VKIELHVNIAKEAMDRFEKWKLEPIANLEQALIIFILFFIFIFVIFSDFLFCSSFCFSIILTFKTEICLKNLATGKNANGEEPKHVLKKIKGLLSDEDLRYHSILSLSLSLLNQNTSLLFITHTHTHTQ